MEAEKISIVIPVYNIEQYLDRCVESVLQQTYRNLDVILVDDGSPDRCGELCDRWAEQDERVRVIHKENGGLSDARNCGISQANGEYIAFVDSDDFIAADMMEKLHRALRENDAEISICNFHFVDEDGAPIERKNRYLPIRDETISGEEAIANMQFDRDGGCYNLAWNKLYRRELFHDIRFPVGKLCEDGFISHRLLGKCERVACIRYVGYYYTQRGGSIMHSGNPLVYLHQAEARIDRMLFCLGCGLNRCAGSAFWQAAMYLADTWQAGGAADFSPEDFNNDLKALRENYALSRFCTTKEKVQTALTCIHPAVYVFFFRNPVWQSMKAARRRVSRQP